MKTAIGISLILLLLTACSGGSPKPTPYHPEVPSHFPAMVVPADNPLTVEGVALGRQLFYDARLSKDNTISCASCHLQQYAFSDNKQYSAGVKGALGNRNSMALINLAWQQSFFWDGRSMTLEQQILEPVPNPVEMHQSWTKTAEKIKADEGYRRAFFKAFQSTTIDSIQVAKAIAQFLRTLISGGSKYDVMYKIEHVMTLNEAEKLMANTITPEEWSGYDLFKSLNGADCFHCHSGPLLQVQKFSNNGLDLTFTDPGREAITGNPNDLGKFKVPTLRNIALTAPYMHDGRFATLDEVIDHYSSGINITPTIDPLIEFAHQGGVQLDANQKSALKKFLLTLTDESFITNPAFSKP